MKNEINHVLHFWFGEIRDGITLEDRNELWFMPNSDVDRAIKEKFEQLVIKAGSGELKEWENAPKGSLALIVLLDQFTRNIYRSSGKAFQYDAHALCICNEGIERGYDIELEIIEKCFYYLPLEHSEKIDDQNRCVQLFEKLMVKANENQIDVIKNSLDYAILHRDIIKEFGRFPHRNAVLGRESTEQELDFLSKQGNKFGQ